MTATRILDLERDPPKSHSRKRVIAIGLLIGLGISAIALLAPAGLYVPGFNFFIWLIALHVLVGLHELGHVVVGSLVGMPLGGLRVGCFQWMKSGERWVFRFNLRHYLGGMMVPLPPQSGFRAADCAWMIAAGPLVSVISIVVCVVLWLNYGDGVWSWIGSSVWASAIGIFSLIPLSSGVQRSDAALLRMLWKNPPAAEGWMALVAVSGENLRGVRPRDWTPALFEKMMSALPEKGGRVAPELYCYCRLLDQRDEESALVHLENCLAASAKAVPTARQMLYLEAAAACAFYRHNAAHARVWRERALKLGKLESGASSSAAIAMCEGRYGDALREIEVARQYILKRNPGAGLALLALERLGEREEECHQAIGNVASAVGA